MDNIKEITGTKELTEVTENSNLPDSIIQTFNTIDRLDREIKTARQAAESAKEVAVATKEMSAGWSFLGSKKKATIEDLQGVVEEIAIAQCKSVDAQAIIFENQQKMAKSIHYLFGLGVANIAANRTIVRELELKLRDASRGELSDLARQELKNTITQLKLQESTMSRIESQKQKIIELEETIKQTNNKFTEIEERLSESDNTLREISNRIDIVEDATKPDDIDSNLESDKTEQLNNKFTEVKERLTTSNNSFLQSKFYKIAIGVISITALLCSIIL